MTTPESIFEMPHIKALRVAELQATNKHSRQRLHSLWLDAMKAEQIKRGQRTTMSYRRTDKKGV